MTANAEMLQIVDLHATAFTAAEVDAADAALRDFRERYPSYAINAEMFHGWYDRVEAIRQREAEARAMGLTPAEVAERDALLRSTLWDGSSGADDLYDEGRLLRDSDRVLAWLRRYPTDPSARARLEGIRGDLEVVGLLKEAGAAPLPPRNRDSADPRELVPA
jgi:hypothetical protein